MTFGSAAFLKETGVSRETLEKIELYHRLLHKWSVAINLVGRDTLPETWQRHFFDSAQLWPHLAAGPVGRLVDMGSGAGFPGMVLAMMGWRDVHLIESDGKKAAFLSAVSRETGTPVTLHNKRVEELSPLSAQWITARALAPLAKLLDYALPHLKEGGACLFLKGRTAEAEVAEAEKTWRFACRATPSRSDGEGRILHLSGIGRRI